MPGSSTPKRRDAALKRATALMTEALDLLDAHAGPPEATAHLDLALQKVREAAKQ